MKKRCKVGDLVIVVRCDNAPENLGAIRTILREEWPGWQVTPALPNGDECIMDHCLRLRGQSGGDETWAGLPRPVEYV